MNKQTTTAILSVVLFSLLFTRPAAAGSWTVVTVDALPLHVEVGEPIKISFLVQQHGIHPLVLSEGAVAVNARHTVTGRAIAARATMAGAPGQYTVELIFPIEGVWAWQIQPGSFPPATMPELKVSAAVDRRPIATPANRDWAPWEAVVWQLLAYVRPQPAVAAPVNADWAADSVAYGKALFVAKGCVTCHVHSAARADFSLQVGPDLTHYRVIPEYVTIWLRDPKSIKPQTPMPNLHLQDAEIEALVAFLSAGAK